MSIGLHQFPMIKKDCEGSSPGRYGGEVRIPSSSVTINHLTRMILVNGHTFVRSDIREKNLLSL